MGLSSLCEAGTRQKKALDKGTQFFNDSKSFHAADMPSFLAVLHPIYCLAGPFRIPFHDDVSKGTLLVFGSAVESPGMGDHFTRPSVQSGKRSGNRGRSSTPQQQLKAKNRDWWTSWADTASVGTFGLQHN